MRKSSLILLLAAAFMLATAAIGFSADEVVNPCKDTCKKWNKDIHITRDYKCSTDQGGEHCPECPIFDYENSYNYCSNKCYYTDDEEYKKCLDRGIIMKICDCPDYDPDSALWSTTAEYRFKVEIISPTSGVYFTNVNYSKPKGCSKQVGCDEGDARNFMATVLDVDALGDTVCPNICTDYAATPVNYSYQPLVTGKKLYDINADYANQACCLDCIGNLSTSIITCEYPLFQGVGNKPYVMLDLPSFVWDPKVIADGDEVVLKVTLVAGSGGTGGDPICPTCKDLCSCIVKIGIFGCPVTVSDQCDLCFPYFPGIDGTWWGGISVTNSGQLPADVTMVFKASGVEKTVTETIDPETVYVKALSQLGLGDLAGKGAIYVSVSGTVTVAGVKSAASLDGFSIMGDGSQAFGYLAKHGKCGCCTGTICSK